MTEDSGRWDLTDPPSTSWYLEDQKAAAKPLATPIGDALDKILEYIDLDKHEVNTRRREYRYGYLNSEHWKKVSAEARRRAGYRCQRCGAGAVTGTILDVHHLTYARRGAELPEDLELVCRPCHDAHHHPEVA